jgi:hypothetical protein
MPTSPTQSTEVKLERICDLDEQTSDGALGSLARYALDELAALDSLEES